MRLRDVKTGVRVRCLKVVDGNAKVYFKLGTIVVDANGNSLPRVRFDRSVKGHGYKHRDWYCNYRDLGVTP